MIYTPQTKPLLGVPVNWAHPLAKGLVGYWAMLEGSGNKIYDLSGNNNVGTLTNMDGSTGGWTPGRSGQALKFDGVDDYVNAGPRTTGLGTADSFTFSAWVYATASTADVKNFITSERTTTFYRAVLGTFTGTWSFALYDGTNNPWANSTNVYPMNVWTHVVGVRDVVQDKLYIYQNGILAGTPVTDTSGDPGTYSNFYLGAQLNQAGRYFNGLIDDVRIYNRALSAQEIWQLYATPYAMFERRPYWMNYVAPAAGGFTSKIMVDGTWKTSSSALVMVDGSWKSVSSGKIMVDGTWKALG